MLFLYVPALSKVRQKRAGRKQQQPAGHFSIETFS
jgi:hypothetical protein